MEPLPADPAEPNPATETIAAPLSAQPRTEGPGGPEPLPAIGLEVVGGPMDGITVHLSKDIVTIGRSPSSDLSLHIDPMVSMHHARIVRDGNGFWLEDMNSRNGTHIGQQRIQARTLIGAGTLFVLGSTSLEFLPC